MRFFVSDYKSVHAFDIESPLDAPVPAWCEKVSKKRTKRKRRPIVSSVYIPPNPKRVVYVKSSNAKQDVGVGKAVETSKSEATLSDSKEHKSNIPTNLPKVQVNDETISLSTQPNVPSINRSTNEPSQGNAGKSVATEVKPEREGLIIIGANGAITCFTSESGATLWRTPFKRFTGLPISVHYVASTDTLVAGVHNYVFVLCPHRGTLLDRLKLSSKEHVSVPNCIVAKTNVESVVAIHSSVSRRVVFLDTKKALDLESPKKANEVEADDSSSSSSEDESRLQPEFGRSKSGEIRVGRKLGKRRKQLSARLGLRLVGRMPAIGAIHVCPDNTVAISRKSQYRAFRPVPKNTPPNTTVKAFSSLGRNAHIPHPGHPRAKDAPVIPSTTSTVTPLELPMKASAKLNEARRLTVESSGERNTPTNFLIDKAGGRLYVAGMFVVSCFELESSKRLWHLDLRQYAGRLNHLCQCMIKVPQSATSSLLIMTFGKRVIAVETNEGKLMWQHVMPKRVLGLKDGFKGNVINGNATAAMVLVFPEGRKKTIGGKRNRRRHQRKQRQKESEMHAANGTEATKTESTPTVATNETAAETPSKEESKSQTLAAPETTAIPSSSDSGYSEPPRPISSKLLLVGANSIFQGLNVQHGTLLFTLKLTTTAASFLSFAGPHIDTDCVSDLGVRGPSIEENIRGEYGRKKKRAATIQQALRGNWHYEKETDVPPDELDDEDEGEDDASETEVSIDESVKVTLTDA